jgi:menaquinone-dependent protoporphyrinogen oxidase
VSGQRDPSPQALVTYASKMGSTAEIAEAIADELRRAGLMTVVHDIGTAPHPEAYDLVVVGSAVYLGRWDRRAVAYLRHHRKVLAGHRISLFQSGPVGEKSARTGPPRRVRRLARRLGCAPPMVFGGNLDHSRAMGPLSRWVSIGIPTGDYRDWDQIRAFARRIAS